MMVGLIGWAVMEHRGDAPASEGAEVVEPKTPSRSGKAAVGVEADALRPRESAEPGSPTDTRDATQRLDDVLADLEEKHDVLLAAGALEAEKTVRARIERLHAAQLEQSRKAE